MPKKVSVPKPRFVFDVKLPKQLKDAIDLALPAVPGKPEIKPLVVGDGLDLHEEPEGIDIFDAHKVSLI